MTPQAVSMSVLFILATLLSAVAASDVQRHRIPNVLVLSGVLLGIVLNSLLAHGLGFANRYVPGAGGFGFAVAGAILGLACLLPFYVLRAMGAGDVKLMAMVGAFLGPADLLGAVLCTFLVGGVLALAVAVRGRTLGLLGQNLRLIFLGGLVNASAGRTPALETPARSAGKLPYGVAIAVGTFAWVLWKMAA